MAKGGFRSPSSFYAAQHFADDPFPKPVHPSPGTSAWVEEEVDDWIARRVAERDGKLMAPPDPGPVPVPGKRRGRRPGSKNRKTLERLAASDPKDSIAA